MTAWLKKLPNTFEFSTLEHLSGKRNCLIVMDEVQRLKLNDKHCKERRDAFVDFIYHDNNWCIMSSANVREFNSIIGGIVERWIIKTIKVSSVVNGSQLKDVIISYSGRFKSIESIVTAKEIMLIINDDCEKYLEMEYIKEIDHKQENIDIFSVQKKSEEKSVKK